MGSIVIMNVLRTFTPALSPKIQVNDRGTQASDQEQERISAESFARCKDETNSWRQDGVLRLISVVILVEKIRETMVVSFETDRMSSRKKPKPHHR